MGGWNGRIFLVLQGDRKCWQQPAEHTHAAVAAVATATVAVGGNAGTSSSPPFVLLPLPPSLPLWPIHACGPPGPSLPCWMPALPVLAPAQHHPSSHSFAACTSTLSHTHPACTSTLSQYTLHVPPPCPIHPLQSLAPPSHTATACTSTLCKLLMWHLEGRWQAATAQGYSPGLLHQADWCASLLTGDR